MTYNNAVIKESGAVILAAGKGSRLNLGETPKAMVYVGGKPILGYPLTALYQSRFSSKSISVVVGVKRQPILDYCGKDVQIKKQKDVNGNLGAIEAGLLDLPKNFTDILVIQADDCLNLSQSIISELLHIHESMAFAITLLLSHSFRPSAHRKHYEIGGEHVVKDIMSTEEMQGQLNVVAGTYCFSRRFVAKYSGRIRERDGEERTITPLVNLAFKQKRLGAVVLSKHWLGVNTPQELLIARNQTSL